MGWRLPILALCSPVVADELAFPPQLQAAAGVQTEATFGISSLVPAVPGIGALQDGSGSAGRGLGENATEEAEEEKNADEEVEEEKNADEEEEAGLVDKLEKDAEEEAEEEKNADEEVEEEKNADEEEEAGLVAELEKDAEKEAEAVVYEVETDAEEEEESLAESHCIREITDEHKVRFYVDTSIKFIMCGCGMAGVDFALGLGMAVTSIVWFAGLRTCSDPRRYPGVTDFKDLPTIRTFVAGSPSYIGGSVLIMLLFLRRHCFTWADCIFLSTVLVWMLVPGFIVYVCCHKKPAKGVSSSFISTGSTRDGYGRVDDAGGAEIGAFDYLAREARAEMNE